MRPLLHGDLVAAARVLLASPPGRRESVMEALMAASEAADRYRKRLGRAHPRFGTGSLMAAAAAWPQAPEPMLDDADYLDCLACALSALRVARSRAARPPHGGRAKQGVSSAPRR